MRPEFAAIVSGWTLISGMGDITDRIEQAAAQTVRPNETERFSSGCGPVKILMRDGKMLDEPEYVEVTNAEPVFSPYVDHRKRKAGK